MKKLGFALLLGALCLGSQRLARAEPAGTNLPTAPLSSAQVAAILGLSLPDEGFPQPQQAATCPINTVHCVTKCRDCQTFCGSSCSQVLCGSNPRGCASLIACTCIQ